MRSPFLVNVASIRGSTGARLEIGPSGHFEGLQTSGTSVSVEADVRFTGAIETIDGGFVAAGTVEAPWTGECRRCLGPAAGTLRVEVREIFEHRPTEGETYRLDGEMLDLEPLVREAVMLDLPVAAVCRDDCAGLCPTCGANRNEAPCDCREAPSDPRWAALDALREPED